MRRDVCTVLTALALLAPSPARAFELRWNAPPSCPDATAARARLDALGDLAPLHLSAQVTVARTAPGAWEARMVTENGDAAGERTLAGATCEAVSDAAVLVLSLAIDGERFDAPPVAPPPPTPPVETSAALEAHDEPAVALPPGVRVTASRRRVRTRGGVGVAAGVREGILPSTAVYGAVEAFVEHDRVRGELRAAMAGGQTIAHGEGAAVTLDAAWVTARACWSWLRRPVVIRTCGGVELGVMRGASVGVRAPGRGASSWTALSAGLAVQVPLTRALGAVAAVDGAWMVDRPGFVVLGDGPVFAPDAPGVSASLGLAWRW